MRRTRVATTREATMRTARVMKMRTTRATKTGTNKQEQANEQKESMQMAGIYVTSVRAAAAACVTLRTNKGQHK